jgi:thiol-disulfide isomerase/thioredoxin
MSRKPIVAVDLVPWCITAILLVVLMLMVVGCDSPKAPCPGPCPGPCKVRVLAFTAEWCEPCRKAAPALMQVQASGVQVRIVDIDTESRLAKQYGVTSVPTYIVYVFGGAVRTQDITMVQRLTQRR